MLPVSSQGHSEHRRRNTGFTAPCFRMHNVWENHTKYPKLQTCHDRALIKSKEYSKCRPLHKLEEYLFRGPDMAHPGGNDLAGTLNDIVFQGSVL